MNRIAIFILTISLIAPFAIYGADQAAETVEAPKDSIYAYSEDDTPEVFFFPKEQARWDGSKVTMKEWYMLTELQKERFITEYIGELERDYHRSIAVMGLDYLEALNAFSYYSDGKSMGSPPTKLIEILLSGQGKMPETKAGMDIELWRKNE